MSVRNLRTYIQKRLIPNIERKTEEFREESQKEYNHQLFLTEKVISELIDSIQLAINNSSDPKINSQKINKTAILNELQIYLNEVNTQITSSYGLDNPLLNLNFSDIEKIRNRIFSGSVDGTQFIYGTTIKIGEYIHRGHGISLVTEQFAKAVRVLELFIEDSSKISYEELRDSLKDVGYTIGTKNYIAKEDVATIINLFKKNSKNDRYNVTMRALLSQLKAGLADLIRTDLDGMPNEVQAIITTNIRNHPIERVVVFELAQKGEDSSNSSKGAITNTIKKRYIKSIKDGILTRLKEDLPSLSSSKTVTDLAIEDIINNIKGLSTKKYTATGKVVEKAVNKKVKKIKLSSISTKVSPKGITPLRNLQGQFTSVTKLESLIRAQLRPTIVKNMHRPNLEYQSGRFADSVKLESISRARDGALSAFLSYMRYPYATFERDGKQGKKGYYPSRLIEGSVREIASKLVRDRMRVVIQ